MKSKKKCTVCNKESVSIIEREEGVYCYNCYMEKQSKGQNKPKSKRKNEEAEIQTEFFNQVNLFFPFIPEKLLFAVPNGGSRNKIEAVNLKRQGVKPGVSDVLLLIPKKGFASLCLEFKTKKGRQSKEQKEFQKQAEMCGSKYVIVRSVKQAIDEMRRYLK